MVPNTFSLFVASSTKNLSSVDNKEMAKDRYADSADDAFGLAIGAYTLIFFQKRSILLGLLFARRSCTDPPSSKTHTPLKMSITT
jgi:hypothetical protein